MFDLFRDNLLPVFLAAGAGYVLAATTRIDPRPVSRVAFALLAPSLILDTLTRGDVTGPAALRIAAFAGLSLFGLAGLAGLIAWRTGCSRTLTAATMLVVLLPNAGNFGLSANLFAFGERGLAFAGVYFVTGAVITFTVGILIASLGRMRARPALVGLLRVPAIWAVAVAAVLISTDTSLPLPLERTVDLFSSACIPMFLIILGMQLRGKGLSGPATPLVTAVGLRLVGGALIGVALAGAIGLEGAARQAASLQSAMPSAVITIVIATEYDIEPAFVTSVVFLTTLLCPLTLTPLLAYLGA